MTDFEALAAKGHANDLQAALDRALAGQCPTLCEKDCRAGCHEGHKPDPDHDPSTCPGTLTYELVMQKDRHAPFGELFEHARRWQDIAFLAGEAVAAANKLVEMFGDKVEEITKLTDREMIWTADIDGTRRAEGWKLAMEAVKKVADTPPGEYTATMLRSMDLLQQIQDLQAENRGE